jgi:hypothetical protein
MYQRRVLTTGSMTRYRLQHAPYTIAKSEAVSVFDFTQALRQHRNDLDKARV